MSGFSNRPKILKGAFVEYGLSIPPLIVAFQFNPETISRDRSNSFYIPGDSAKKAVSFEYFQKFVKLKKVREGQHVEFGLETISFDIRLDATDKLDKGNPVTQQFGIAPELSTLELMMSPKTDSLAVAELIGLSEGHTFTGNEKPPMLLFIWGRKKVLPVNLTSMKVKEEEFSTDLNPLRATVSVGLTVIEGPNTAYQYSKAMKEVMSALNLANITDVANVIIPL